MSALRLALPPRARDADARSETRLSVNLLRNFEVRAEGETITLPMSAQRLVAFLALNDRPLLRASVAGSLWLESSEERAGASLRSALWRARRQGVDLVDDGNERLGLLPCVHVDFRETTEQARCLFEATALPAAPGTLREALSWDLLPDWTDDWVLLERERFRQLRMHALEHLCRMYTSAGRWAEAVDAGLASVSAEPLRESGHRALIAVHFAEGNQHEAIRLYESYRDMLRRELSVEPSPLMERLMAEGGA